MLRFNYRTDRSAWRVLHGNRIKAIFYRDGIMPLIEFIYVFMPRRDTVLRDNLKNRAGAIIIRANWLINQYVY